MWKKTKKIMAICLLLVAVGCISTDQEQQARNNVMAQSVERIENKIDQKIQLLEKISILEKKIEAESIYYGGAGWVAITAISLMIVFVVAVGLWVRWLFKQIYGHKKVIQIIRDAVRECDPGTAEIVRKKAGEIGRSQNVRVKL